VQPLPAEVPFLERAGPEVLEQEVGLCGELEQEGLAFRLAQVERDRLLVARDHRPPERRVARLLPAPDSHRVALARRLDLDDLGPKVAEQLTAERASQQGAQLEHPQVSQGPVLKNSRCHDLCIQSKTLERQPSAPSRDRLLIVYTIKA